jgi:hypothetical protein
MCPTTSRRSRRHALLGQTLLLCSLSLGVQAQQASRPQATDAQAPVPPLRHQSALPAHTRSAPLVVGDWAALIRQVARIGGWRAYAREAASAAAPASAASPALAPSQPAGVPR